MAQQTTTTKTEREQLQKQAGVELEQGEEARRTTTTRGIAENASAIWFCMSADHLNLLCHGCISRPALLISQHRKFLAS